MTEEQHPIATNTRARTTRRGVMAGLAAALVPTGPAGARIVRLPSELVNEVLSLPGRITLGSRTADVTLIEFFDYNCGFCRRTAAEVRPLLQSDPQLRYILVNYAILGVASIEASRVALAASLQKTEGGYLALHERLFKQRGRVDAIKALGVATELGANRERLIQDADSDRVTDALKRASTLGDNLGLIATPAFVAGREAVIGYLDLAEKQKAIANLRRCEALGC